MHGFKLFDRSYSLLFLRLELGNLALKSFLLSYFARCFFSEIIDLFLVLLLLLFQFLAELILRLCHGCLSLLGLPLLLDLLAQLGYLSLHLGNGCLELRLFCVLLLLELLDSLHCQPGLSLSLLDLSVLLSSICNLSLSSCGRLLDLLL